MNYRNYADNFIMLVILGNIIVMCMTYDDIPDIEQNKLNLFNDVFTLIFLMECLLKIFGMGIFPYLYSGANVFDLSLVLLSIGDYMMEKLSNSSDGSKASINSAL